MVKLRYDRTVEHLAATGRLVSMLKADELLRKFNSLPLIAQEEQAAVIRDLFGSVGENPSVSRGFYSCRRGTCKVHQSR